MEPRASFHSVIVLPRRRKRTTLPILEYETSDDRLQDDDDDDTTVASSVPQQNRCQYDNIMENTALLLLASVVVSGVGTWVCLHRMFQLLYVFAQHTVCVMFR